jgi:chaperonin cofactor prefoldin
MDTNLVIAQLMERMDGLEQRVATLEAKQVATDKSLAVMQDAAITTMRSILGEPHKEKANDNA